MKSLFAGLKIRPTTARDFKVYTCLCACLVLSSAWHLYQILQWTYLHGMMDEVNSKTLCSALHIELFGPPDLSVVPVLVIVERILSRILFWGGSGFIFASYSSKMDRCADAYRLVGFLFFGTVCLDIATTMLATGQGHLFFANSFGTVRETLITLIMLSVVAFFLFPRYKVKP